MTRLIKDLLTKGRFDVLYQFCTFVTTLDGFLIYPRNNLKVINT